MSPENLPVNCIIEVNNIPSGSAPEGIRVAWVGLKFIATPTDLNTLLVDPIARETVLPRYGYRVSREVALDALRTVGQTEAASYFEREWPEGMDFVFMADDVKLEEEE